MTKMEIRKWLHQFNSNFTFRLTSPRQLYLISINPSFTSFDTFCASLIYLKVLLILQLFFSGSFFDVWIHNGSVPIFCHYTSNIVEVTVVTEDKEHVVAFVSFVL